MKNSLFGPEDELFDVVKIAPPKWSTKSPSRKERRLHRVRTVEQSSFQKPKTYSEYKEEKAEQAKNEAEETDGDVRSGLNNLDLSCDC